MSLSTPLKSPPVSSQIPRPNVSRYNPLRRLSVLLFVNPGETHSKMSAKTTPGPKLVRIHGTGGGVRGRDIEFPRAPVRVSDQAQARPLDINTIRQFNFNQEGATAAVELPLRPSTASGPGNSLNSSARWNADRRETQDDLCFGISHEKTTIFYDFPLPGSLPTPTHSPRESSLPPRNSSLPRSFTPDSAEMGRHMEIPQMEIGMALGSPTHHPAVWQPQSIHQVRSPSPDTFQESVDDRVPPITPAKQRSKWKMFGGLFGGNRKQNPAITQNFYQLQPDDSQANTEKHQLADDVPKESLNGRTNSERKASKKKPDVKRSNTAPIVAEPPPTTGQGNPEILLDGHQISDPEQKEQGGLMLDVAIPSVEMERYSVMFGSLLQKQPSSTSSLLARRQATLDRLKTANEELILKVPNSVRRMCTLTNDRTGKGTRGKGQTDKAAT